MGTPVTGELRPLSDGWEARIRIDDEGTRRGFALLAFTKPDRDGARARCTAMATIAVRLRKAGHADKVEDLLRWAAKARSAKWDAVLAAVDKLCSGTVEPLSEAARMTVADFGKQWRSGELHAKYPDHVKKKDSARDDEIAKLYVDPGIGHLRVADVTLDDLDDEVMAKIEERHASWHRVRYGTDPKKPLTPASRRHIAQYVRRLLGLAVYPGRLRDSNPIPKGWLPRVKDAKAKECLYPDEDRTLLGCRDLPVVRRLAFGFLCREGMRADEMARLEWRDVDLERGRVDLDENKTDDPRSWDLDPGVLRALKAWKKRRGMPTETEKVAADSLGRLSRRHANVTERVFAEDGIPINVDRLADQLRSDLRRAGVTREKLFEHSETRQQIRAHDLRATFVTISLACGRSETWVADRTGHKSSTMINRYRRKARTWKVGPLDDLDAAIPELSGTPPRAPHDRPTRASSRRLREHLERTRTRKNRAPREMQDGASVSKSAEVTPREGSSPSFGTTKKQGSRHASEGAAESAPHEHGALRGALAILDRLTIALARATEAGQWKLAEVIAAQLERVQLAGEE